MNRYLPLLGIMAFAATAIAAAPQVPPWGTYLTYIDKSVKPGDDFYEYANGGWQKTAQIPGDRYSSGVYLDIDLQNEARLKSILNSLAASKDITPEQAKLRDFYNAFMDRKKIEADRLKPAEADLIRIEAARTGDDIAKLMSDPELLCEGLFGLFIVINDKHPRRYSITLTQSGIGLPDRDYYSRNDKAIVATRDTYKRYLAQMLSFTSAKDASKRAEAVFRLESEVAAVQWSAQDANDSLKTYNPMTIADLKKFAPQFPWDAYFAGADISPRSPLGPRTVIVKTKSTFPQFAAIFARTPVSVWRDYLTVRYLHNFASVLPKQIDDADFAMYGHALQGTTTQLDRQTRAIQLLDPIMGQALGKLYVARYFSPEAKTKVTAVVRNLLAAYVDDLRSLSWMTPATRAKAIDKIRHYGLKIGYPDKWRDYSALTVSPDDPLQNMKNGWAFEWHRQLARIDRPVDRTDWQETPQTNDAYYNPTLNEIVLPAGELQPPFFDPNADDAVNYGGEAAGIGHEISHGFDDQGSKYDADGTLREWWTTEDRKAFDARTDALVKQYNQYEPLAGMHINGKLTLSENIADLGGLVIAHKAYRIALGGKRAPLLKGYTGDQRFYIAYGQSWREKMRENTLRELLLSDEHSPSIYRVDGVVRNDDGWYAAFPGIKQGDKLYLPPDQRVHIW